MPTQNLPLVPGTLGAGYCYPADPQTLYNDMFALGVAQLTGAYNLFNYGNATPAPEDQNKPWLKTVAGAPERWYVHSSGFWIWPNPAPADGAAGATQEVRIWAGPLGGGAGGLDLYDGGETGVPVSASAGPMWTEATEFRGRSPMGVDAAGIGEIPTIVGMNKGEATHMQLQSELFPHSHTYGVMDDPAVGSGVTWAKRSDAVATTATYNPSTSVFPPVTTPQTAFNVVHPVRGVYFIKRTARVNYRGA